MSGKQVRKSIGSICGVDSIGPSTIELITALGSACAPEARETMPVHCLATIYMYVFC